MKRTNFYVVTVRCGHVGKNNYIPVSFPVYATSGKEAAKIGRNMPRAKHDAKNCVISVENITEDQFFEFQQINNFDPYLKCKNHQEQQLYLDNIYFRICENPEVKKYKKNGHSLRRVFNDYDVSWDLEADIC